MWNCWWWQVKVTRARHNLSLLLFSIFMCFTQFGHRFSVDFRVTSTWSRNCTIINRWTRALDQLFLSMFHFKLPANVHALFNHSRSASEWIRLSLSNSLLYLNVYYAGSNSQKNRLCTTIKIQSPMSKNQEQNRHTMQLFVWCFDTKRRYYNCCMPSE